MKRLQFSFFLSVMALLWMQAAPVTPEKARHIAEQYFAKGVLRSEAPLILSYTQTVRKASSLRSTSLQDFPLYYLFNRGEKDGFVLVAADDRCIPILASCEEGHVDMEQLPDNLAYWLHRYELQIASMLEIDLNVGSQPKSGVKFATDVSPLLDREKIVWDQRSPYNRQTPTINGVKSCTGCVATATAQIMRFWKWPQRAVHTTLSYVDTYNKRNKKMEREIGLSDYLWNKMPASVVKGKITEQEADEIARLMADVGYACQMTYCMDDYGSSGTFSQYASRALRNYFHYKNSALIRNRHNYDMTSWATLVYNELVAGRPVYYSGAFELSGAGHAFVCDGYRKSDGAFHFNWGWSGTANGYYQLDALAPLALGAGAGMGLFSGLEEIIVGLEPAMSNDAGILEEGGLDFILRLASDESRSDDQELYYVFLNSSDIDFKGAMRIGLFNGDKPEGDPLYTVVTKSDFSVDILQTDEDESVLPTLDIADGTYCLGAQIKPEKAANWKPTRIYSDEPNSARVTIKNKKIIGVEYDACTRNLSIDEKSLQLAFNNDYSVDFTFSVSNTSTREFYGVLGILVVPTGGKLKFERGNYSIAQTLIPAKESIEYKDKIQDFKYTKGKNVDIYALASPVSEDKERVASHSARLSAYRLTSTKVGENLATEIPLEITNEGDLCYPTVAAHELNLIYKDVEKIAVCDMTGNMLATFSPSESGEMVIAVGDYPAGNYMVLLTKNNGEKHALHFTVAK